MVQIIFVALSFLVSMGKSALADTNFANACDRSEGVKVGLMSSLRKDCSKITQSDIESIKELTVNLNVRKLGVTNQLKTGDFEGLNSLVDLRIEGISHTSTGYVVPMRFQSPPNVFEGLKNLKSLSLVLLNFDQIPEGFFNGLSKIEKLDFDACIIDSKKLFSTSFKELVSLRTLRLTVGYPSFPSPNLNIPDDSFENFRNLESLNIDGHLKAITSGTFHGLESLRYLSISINKSTEITEGPLLENKKLEYLYVGSASGVSIPRALVGDLPQLKTLDIGGDFLNDTFKGLKSLTKLYLTLTQDTSFEENVFEDLKNLKELRISGSDVYYAKSLNLPAGLFWNQQNLENLTVEEFGGIVDFSMGIFDRLYSIKTLAIKRTSMTNLPKINFENLPNLVEFSVMSNKIKNIPSGFFKSLQSLSQSERRLIRFDSNQISTIEEGAFDVFADHSNKTDLYLSFNVINTIKPGVFQPFEAQKIKNIWVYLGGNMVDQDTRKLLEKQLGRAVQL